MPIRVDVSQRKGAGGALATVVSIAGVLDGDTVDPAEQALKPVLAHPGATVVFDLAGLTFVSSAGISLFLMTRKALEAQGTTVGVVGMRPPIQKVFDIVKVLPASKVFANVKEMDDYLAAMQRRVAGDEE